MTNKEIERIKQNGKLPKDELDDFWDNFAFLIIIISFLGISIFGFYKGLISYNILGTQIALLVFSSVIFFYTIWSKKNEKNLKKIKTSLSLDKNKIIINQLCKNKNWEVQSIQNTYFVIYIKAIFNIRTHKLIIICSEKEILFNLRNVGSYKGRMPYNFGIDSFKEYQIRKRIKNNVQQWL